MARFVSLLAALLSLVTLQTPACAFTIYDASVSLSISSPSVAHATLTLSPGLAFAPPPIIFGAANASSGATASVPGHIQAAASGVAFGFGEGSDAFGTSRATAIGFGSIEVRREGMEFPLRIHEEWSVSASGTTSLGAEAFIRFLVLLDSVLIHSGSGSATFGAFGGGPGFASDDRTTTLSIGLDRGVHSLVFVAEASGLAATPEPTSLLLLGTTMAGLGLARWNKRRKGPS
jgi:hypothetical protein